ncbi:MAG: amidase family protein [Gammaproteobacteria bacterium]|nr:amidase family protein [Gammaproteobacteria bacterium]
MRRCRRWAMSPARPTAACGWRSPPAPPPVPRRTPTWKPPPSVPPICAPGWVTMWRRRRRRWTARPFNDAFMAVWSSGAAARLDVARRMELDPEDVLEPWTLGLAAAYEKLPESALADALAYFAQMERLFEAFFSRYDVLLTPTLAAPPPQIGEQAPTVEYATLYDRVLDWVAYTPIHNAAGTAAMSVPLGWSSNSLPIGMQFATQRGGERTLFELAYELEAAAPWADRWPEMVTG